MNEIVLYRHQKIAGNEMQAEIIHTKAIAKRMRLFDTRSRYPIKWVIIKLVKMHRCLVEVLNSEWFVGI
jgi:hypothetical protein